MHSLTHYLYFLTAFIWSYSAGLGLNAVIEFIFDPYTSRGWKIFWSVWSLGSGATAILYFWLFFHTV